jgi:hypothetical protein
MTAGDHVCDAKALVTYENSAFAVEKGTSAAAVKREANCGTAEEVAEKIGFVSGHDFSRAATA